MYSNFNIILQILTQLPVILKEEEDEAYNNEVGLSESEDIINKQRNDAVRTIAIGHIVEKVVYFCTMKFILFFIFYPAYHIKYNFAKIMFRQH